MELRVFATQIHLIELRPFICPLQPVAKHARPSMRQEERQPPIDKPELVDVQSASGGD
jgi:hypothetical protein